MDVQANRTRLQQVVLQVLNEHPTGINRNHLWNLTAKKLGQSPRASDYGYAKMSQMFPHIQQFYQEFKVGKDVHIRLKQSGGMETEIISSDEDDFPSLLSSSMRPKAKPSNGHGSKKSPQNKIPSESFLSLDVGKPSKDRTQRQTRKESLDKLKSRLVKLLKKKGKIIRTQLWGHFQQEYQLTPKGSDYGVTKMADVLEKFTDVIEEKRIGDENYLLLRASMKSMHPGLSWGQGAAAHSRPGIGRTSNEMSSDESSDSSDSDAGVVSNRIHSQSDLATQPTVPQKMVAQPTVPRPTVPRPTVPRPTVPLDNSQTMLPNKFLQGTPLVHAMACPVPIPLYFSPQQVMPSNLHPGIATARSIPVRQVQSAVNLRQPFPIQPGSSETRTTNHPRDRSQSRDRHQSRDRRQSRDRHDSGASSHGSETHAGKSTKLERKDIQVAMVTCRGPPTKEQIDTVAKECIAILAEANEHVSLERVEQLLCQRYGVRSVRELNSGIRYIDQILSINEHGRLLCKVNLYVQAFVKARSLCTLFELSECMKEFTKDKRESFDSLKLGPLQRLPVVYDLFKFPSDEELQEITTMDVLEHLRDYMSMNNKWTERLEMENVMKYLVEEYNLDTAYSLGVRIRSLPLAVQMLKKSQRDAASTRRAVTESFKEDFKKELAGAFQKFKAAIFQTAEDGESEVRRHYLSVKPEVAIMEISQKFQRLMSIDAPETRAELKRHVQLETTIKGFLNTMNSDHLGRLLLHLAICISNTTLEESAMEHLAPPTPARVQESSETRGDQHCAKQPPSKAAVLDNLKKYVERCLARGSLSLELMARIEERLLEDFDYPSFKMMGFGHFLNFILNEPAAKSLLEDAGGTMFGSSSTSSDSGQAFRPQMVDILEMVSQCRSAGFSQNEKIESALLDQFLVSDIRHLGFGKVQRLISAADNPGKHKSSEPLIIYEAAITTRASHGGHGQVKVGILGHQPRDHALACLHNCPMLADLAEWSHWSLVFEPQHGKLKEFIRKYGGITTVNIDAGTKTLTTDIVAMETQLGKLLKLVSQTSPEKFQHALYNKDASSTCGHLVSIVMMNKGLENTPTALLANHMKTALFSMHTSANQTPGSPPAFSDPAVQFVQECLVTLPFRICVALASQIFLDPLGQVVGATKSKSMLLSCCRNTRHIQQLEKLGCLLGIQEWTDSLVVKCRPPPDAITLVYSAAEVKELMEQELVVESESEELSESESESDSDDLDAILSDEGETTLTATSSKKTLEETVNETANEDDESEMEKSYSNEEETSSNTDVDDDDEKDNDNTDKEASDDESPTDSEGNRLSRFQQIVANIRREEFGIGIELNEDGRRLMEVQQQRLGRSLDRLSKDLYSKDTHFVLELIQNADDNSYPDDVLKNLGNLCPSVKFRMDSGGVTVLNNECGFSERNIRALCDVGRSTKGKHKFGYIGQKGIGFKSVFRITDCPEVHSSGFHIKFDVKSGPTGYILPHWVETDEESQEGWVTRIYLPLKDEMSLQTRLLAARFNDIHPSLLLFLHRLREITVENLIECSVMTMRRRDLGEGIVAIDHGTKVDRWLVVKKLLDASKISIQAKSGVEVESTEIALAFPLQAKNQKMKTQILPARQPVFAFLPLRSYGFRFIIQGDFDVPSSREDVDRDSPWNQWLCNEIHTLFIEALDIFRSHSDFSNMEALSTYLQFVPMEDEILDFFRPVANQILGKLRSRECLPVQGNKKGAVQLKIPSQTVIVRDALLKEIVPADILEKTLNLYYLHNEVAMTLTPSLAQSLGVESITIEHLLQIGKALILSWETQIADSADKVHVISKWLACVYRSLDEFHENDAALDCLKSTKIIPLSTGQLVALAEVTVFLPPVDSARSAMTTGQKDMMSELHRDLNMVHVGLITTSDNEVNSQCQKLLQKLGVKLMSPYDIIHYHILPTLKSDNWQNKSRDILISYLVFIKYQSERQPSLINMAELKSLARVATNNGVKKPSEDAVHFTPAYGNRIDLQRQLSGYSWILLDAVYLNQVASPHDVQRWHEFFVQLGVTNFFSVVPTEVQLTKESMVDSPWAPFKDIWPESDTGYHITDFVCEEFSALVTRNTKPDQLKHQLTTVFEILDRDWDGKYSKFQHVQVHDGNGHVLKDTESSFSLNMTGLAWVPGIKMSLEDHPGGGLRLQEELSIAKPCDLYRSDPRLKQILGHTVQYIAVSSSVQSSFTHFLRVKNAIETSVVKKLLIEWGKRDEGSPSTPRVFRSCLAHLKAVYKYLSENLVGKEHQDLYHDHPVIFVPETNIQDANDQNFVRGKMLNRSEVWWNDLTNLFGKYRDLLLEYHSDLANKHPLAHLYHDFIEIFIQNARIDGGPKLVHFADLLSLIATVHSPTNRIALSDTLSIFAIIGQDVLKVKNEIGSPNEKLLRKSDLDAAVKKLRKQKIFPTKKDVWVSVDDNPMIVDNRELEKMFVEEKNVHFVVLEDAVSGGRKTRTRKARDPPKHDQDSILEFLGQFQIARLTDCIHTEEVTEMTGLCPRLQLYMHRITPFIQCYLYYNYDDVYQKLVADNVVANLKLFTFHQVGKLDVIYTLKNNPEPRVIRSERCMRNGTQFYFDKSHVDSYPDINREIAKYFSGTNDECCKFLKSFLGELTPVLDDPEGIESLMDKNEMDPMPDDEEQWSVLPPLIPEPVKPPPPSRQVTEKSEAASESDGGMRAWPPKSSLSGQDLIDAPPKKSKGREPSTDSKMWPPPKPPEYHKQMRHLPDNIKVIYQDADQSDTASVKHEGDETPTASVKGSEGRETTASKPRDLLIIRSESRDGTSPRSPVQEVARGKDTDGQVDEEGAGTVKRKLSEGEMIEAKRPSAGGASSHESGNVIINVPSQHDQFPAPSSSSESQVQTIPGTKRRFNSESEVACSPKRAVFFKAGDPTWSESASELVYEELVSGTRLQIPDHLVVDDDDKPDMSDVGRWGETVVHDYLQQQRSLHRDIVDVIWVNEKQESGLPYDFEIICLGSSDDEAEASSSPKTVYIEVKSTLKDEKKHFEISAREVNFAYEKKERYQIYRIFNAGDPENVKLLRIDSISLKMDHGNVKLFMYI